MFSNLLFAVVLTFPYAAPDAVLDPVAQELAAAREAYLVGDLDRTHEILLGALEQAPGEPTLHLWLARVLNDLGRGPEAERILRPALDANDGSAWLWLELGRALHASGHHGEAEAAYRAALERQPHFGQARLNLVELLLESDRATQADTVLAPLVAQAGEATPVLLARAAVANALGSAAQAEALLRAAPDSPPLRTALVRLLHESDRSAEAWELAAPLVEAAQDANTLVFLATVAEAADRRVEALTLLASALSLEKTHPVALGTLNELLEHHAPELRRGLTQRWVAARPDDAQARRELLETDLDEGRFEAFFQQLEELPPHLRAATPVQLLEGEALRRAGRDDEARRVLESICTAADEPRAWYELGLLEYAAEDPAAAARAFERGAAGPWAADAHFNRGVCLDRLERYADAARAYQADAELRPELAEAWYRLGAAQRFRLGNPAAAREAYRRYLQAGGDDPDVRRFVEQGQ